MYSIVLVSTIMLSPDSINGGTWIFNPLSKVAGLYDDETVCPFKATSVVSILHVTWFGKSIEIGLKVVLFEVDYFICWGTPDELETYNYWESCFNKWKDHPYKITHK